MKRLAILVIAILTAASPAVAAVEGRVIQENLNLQEIFPNPDRSQNMYLEGSHANGDRAVLWFEFDAGRNEVFRVYNSAPESATARCHYDSMKWKAGYLLHIETVDQCGDHLLRTTFDPEIVLMPELWSRDVWFYPVDFTETSTRIRTTAYQDSVESVICEGTLKYANFINPTQYGFHLQTFQVTAWHDVGECAGWEDTRWQEDYYFRPGGLYRLVGGPHGTLEDHWDITFQTWFPLP